MFGKLLKHDFNAIFKSALPLSIAALVGSISSGLSSNLLNNSDLEAYPLLDALFGLVSVVGVLVIIGTLIGIQILIYSHFYKNLFTDEGYLTFTLPVKRSSILLSKTLNAMIWTALSGALAIVLTLVSTLFAGDAASIVSFFEFVAQIFKEASFSEGFWIVIYILEAILIGTAYSALQINLIQFCIAFGSTLAKKHKLLAAFGIYYAVNSVLSFSAQILAITGIEPVSNWFRHLSQTNPSLLFGAIALILLAVFIILSAVAVTFYVLSLRRIKYHLNIA